MVSLIPMGNRVTVIIPEPIFLVYNKHNGTNSVLKGEAHMGDVKVERLKINYKTLEEFQKFREYGLEELSMLDDLRRKYH